MGIPLGPAWQIYNDFKNKKQGEEVEWKICKINIMNPDEVKRQKSGLFSANNPF